MHPPAEADATPDIGYAKAAAQVCAVGGLEVAGRRHARVWRRGLRSWFVLKVITFET
jgi:hypothetical protein